MPLGLDGRAALRCACTVAAAGLALASAGCGSSADSDAAIEDTLRQGIDQIQAPHTAKQLRDQLEPTLARMRASRPSSAAGRSARRLAVQGFSWTLRGVQARLDITVKDSGKLEAAVRDAKRADRALNRGAQLLRAAGRALELRIGLIDGH